MPNSLRGGSRGWWREASHMGQQCGGQWANVPKARAAACSHPLEALGYDAQLRLRCPGLRVPGRLAHCWQQPHRVLAAGDARWLRVDLLLHTDGLMSFHPPRPADSPSQLSRPCDASCSFQNGWLARSAPGLLRLATHIIWAGSLWVIGFSINGTHHMRNHQYALPPSSVNHQPPPRHCMARCAGGRANVE